VGELHVQEYRCDSRVGVVLRFGTIIGDDALTRWQLRLARNGRPIGIGEPSGWTHPVHTDDLGRAVTAALTVPSGVYNVGAEPVLRSALVRGFAEAAGRREGAFLRGLMRRLAGPRLEPLARSLRVSSARFAAQAGWTPGRPSFDPSWFDVVQASSGALP
jgi:nucleoside-diphosphate-sugar epimerase